MLKVPAAIVSVHWLKEHLHDKDLIVLDASIKKVTDKDAQLSEVMLPNAQLFDLRNTFLDTSSELPNTIPTPESFELNIRKLGITENSCIVIYDRTGVYSAPRAWWLCKTFGLENVAVLDGGLPVWMDEGYEVVPKKNVNSKNHSSFKAVFDRNVIATTHEVLDVIKTGEKIVIDARSEGRFKGIDPEPRKGLKGGHIPNSFNLPFSEVMTGGCLKQADELQGVFEKLNPTNKDVVFTCGSGVTACILGLASSIAGFNNYTIYDGSWTAWASTNHLPIEK